MNLYCKRCGAEIGNANQHNEYNTTRLDPLRNDVEWKKAFGRLPDSDADELTWLCNACSDFVFSE